MLFSLNMYTLVDILLLSKHWAHAYLESATGRPITQPT